MLLNVTEIGSPKVNNGVVSGFSSANYLKITDSFDVSVAQSWEIVYKIKTGSNITNGQSVCGHTGSSNYDPFTIDINSSKFQLGLCKSSSSNLLKDQKGTYTVLVDTTYWLKLTFDGSKYALSYSLDGVDFIEDVVLESTTKIWTSNLVLGRQQGDASEYPFLGSIDLNECYIKINGELWWTGMVEGGIKPVQSYVLKRKETKYYKEIVTEKIDWYCFGGNVGLYVYFDHEIPVVGEKPYCHSEGALIMVTDSSQITQQLPGSVANVTDEGIDCYFGNSTLFLEPYTEGNLTTVTTELVTSTKDDYDVVKTEDSYYSLRTKNDIKYYKEVVTEGDVYKCFVTTTNETYHYAKVPYVVGDCTYLTSNGSLATNGSELNLSTNSIVSINSDGSITLNSDKWGLKTTPYTEGDLTTTTTELVESTKDDYDVIKEFEGNSYSLYRR